MAETVRLKRWHRLRMLKTKEPLLRYWDPAVQNGMDTAVDHVTDFSQIAAYGVMTTPALVVDGKVVSMGKVLKTEEVKKILQKMRG